MTLDRLLWFCLAHDTRLEDERLAVSIDRRSDETILRFKSDSKEFREQFLGSTEQQLSCDGIYFYKFGKRDPVLVFVELKGANLPHALKQLGNVISVVKPELCRAIGKDARCLALVVSDGATPNTRQNAQRQFERSHRVDLRVRSMRRGKAAVDLRDVLLDFDETLVRPA